MKKFQQGISARWLRKGLKPCRGTVGGELPWMPVFRDLSMVSFWEREGVGEIWRGFWSGCELYQSLIGWCLQGFFGSACKQASARLVELSR